MDADFGIFPPASEEQHVDHAVDEKQLFEDIERALAEFAELLPPPVVGDPPSAAASFPIASGADGYAPLQGSVLTPAGGFGVEAEYMRLGFTGIVPQNSLPSAALPALSPSSSLASELPSPLTPPEGYGNWAPHVNTTAFSGLPINPSLALGADATIDPFFLTRECGSGIGHPGPHIQGLNTVGGSTYPCRFGEEAASRQEFGFRYQIPRDHPNFHRPSHPKPSGYYPFFGKPAPQYAPQTQGFVQGSSSSSYPSGWLAVAPQLPAMPPQQFVPYSSGSSLPSNYAPNPPSIFADNGYVSTFNAFGGIPSPPGHVGHHNDAAAVAGPSAPSSTLGKRKAQPPSNSGPSKARKTKTSTRPRPSKQAPSEPEKENVPVPAPEPPFEPQFKTTHKIDWSKPQMWNETEITERDINKMLSHIKTKHKLKWGKLTRCLYGDCKKQYAKTGAMRAHIVGAAHWNWRLECLRCGWDVRADNFSYRHTKEHCDKKYAKKNAKGGKQGE